MLRLAVAASLFAAVVSAVAAEDEPKPRDATVPLRTKYYYGGLEVKGVPKPEPVPDLPLREPEKLVGETRFHVPTGAIASLPSPDGKLIVSAGGNTFGYPLWLFDAKTGKEVARFYGHTAPVNQMQFSPDGKLLFTGGWPVGTYSTPDGTLRVWDVAAKTEVFTAPARCWALTPDAALLLTVEDRHVPNDGPDGDKGLVDRSRPVAVVRDAKTWKVLKEYELAFRPASADISADGKRLAFGTTDGLVRMLDRASGKELRKFADLKKDDAVANVAFSPDGKRVAAAAVPTYLGSDAVQVVMVWDADTGGIVHALGGNAVGVPEKEKPPLDAHRGGVVALKFTPDGKHLLSADWGGRLICWDLVAGRDAAAKRKYGTSQPIHLDADGKRAFLGNHGPRPGVLSVPDLAEKPLVADAAKPELPFDTAGKVPAAADRREVLLADAKTLKNAVGFDGGVTLVGGSGQVYKHFDKGRVVVFDVTADGKTLATYGHNLDGQGWDHPLKLWEVESGKELAALRVVPRPEYSLRFSPDGTRLAVLHQDGYVRVWDVKEKKAVLALDPAWHWPGKLTWSKDGTKLVGGTTDAPILVVWDVMEKK
jgi:WD40 repeat protein